MASIRRLGNDRESVRYAVRWRAPDGKHRSKTFKKKRDADAYMAKVATEINDGSYIDPAAGRKLLNDYAEEWFTVRARDWRQSTEDRQRSVYANHIEPTLGRRPLGRLLPSEVERWFVGLELADSTRVGVLNLLSSILKAAVRDRKISTNPAEGVKRPTLDERVLVPLGLSDVEALADAAPPYLRAAVVLAAAGGFRQGELFGITVGRLGPQQVRVDQQLVTPSKGAPYFGKPKRKRSTRTVHLPAFAMAELNDHLEQFGAGPDGLVFTNTIGRAWRRNTANDAFQRMVRAAEVDPEVATGWHALRHHCASVLIAQNVSVTGVAAQLGHSPAECLETYAHWWPDEGAAVRSAMESAWNAPRPVRALYVEGGP